MLRLAKTIADACKSCGSVHSIRDGLGSHCSGCGKYTPAELRPLSTKALQDKFQKLMELQKQLKFQIEELERIVK